MHVLPFTLQFTVNWYYCWVFLLNKYWNSFYSFWTFIWAKITHIFLKDLNLYYWTADGATDFFSSPCWLDQLIWNTGSAQLLLLLQCKISFLYVMIDQTDIKRPLRNVTALVKVIFAIKASIFLMLNEKSISAVIFW